ncbi:MAG: thioesterase family protein [Anaerolineae bacterium]|nr:thioesterase family protein [Anaerolineae bacterium]
MDLTAYIQPGLSRQQNFDVQEKHTAPHVGSGAMRVLATPWMIAFMEITARILLDEHLPPGHSSVGVLVNVRHLAPSALGSTVQARVAVEQVERSLVTLAVAVWDQDEQIGSGWHERHIIDVQRFLKRLDG